MSYEIISEEAVKELREKGLTDDQINEVLKRLKPKPEKTTPSIPETDEDLDRLIRQKTLEALSTPKAGSTTSIGEVMGWITVQEMLERRRDRQPSPETTPLKTEVGKLSEAVEKLLKREEAEAEKAARAKEFEPIQNQMKQLQETVQKLEEKLTLTPPTPPEESPTIIDMKDKLVEATGKIENLEKIIEAKELEGVKTSMLETTKTELAPLKSDLIEMKGRLEGIGEGKGTVDKSLQRERIALTGIDRKLDTLITKFPDAEQLIELWRAQQPIIPRTTPPRTESEKQKIYQQATPQTMPEPPKETPAKTEAKTGIEKAEPVEPAT